MSETDLREVARVVFEHAAGKSQSVERYEKYQQRMEAEEARSTKRLKSIRANDLAPQDKVRNYDKNFSDHAVALGVVSGISKLQGVESTFGNATFGPQLGGFLFSSEQGRFADHHTMLTYVNDAEYMGNGAKKLNIQRSSIPTKPFAIKIFSDDYAPTKNDIARGHKRATIADPATRVLVFDFDQKQYDPEFVKSEVLGMCQILHDSGIYNWIVDSSSTGGYHVIAMLNNPALLSQVSRFFNGIAPAFKTLDIQPMISTNGAITVPYSLGKMDGTRRRLLVHARNEQFVLQHRVNRYSVWADVSDRLLEQVKKYDAVHEGKIAYDQRSEKLALAALELWTDSLSVCQLANSSEKDPLRLEQQHLERMDAKTYDSASEERFSIAGAMVRLYGFSDDNVSMASSRLKTSNDPLPKRYRKLVKASSGKTPLDRAVDHDLRSAISKSTLSPDWSGQVNGSSFTRTATSQDVEYTPEMLSLVQHVISSFESSQPLSYPRLAILRAYLQNANARHVAFMEAEESDDDADNDRVVLDPFVEPVEFALSVITRATGLPHGSSYENTMSCTMSEGSASRSACREAGAAEGLFCECHRQWGPYFEVVHFGHLADSDHGSLSSECRNEAVCIRDGHDSRDRASTYVQFKSYPVRALSDSERESWLYQYFISRDPIFLESALGSVGFHAYYLISRAEGPYFNADLEKEIMRGRSVRRAVDNLTEAGLVGRASATGTHAALVANTIDQGSLEYRLQHERTAHAYSQSVLMKSSMVGTGNITRFVLSFSNDLPRMYALVRRVLKYRAPDDNIHDLSELLDPDGNIIDSLAEFREAYGFPKPTGQESFIIEVGNPRRRMGWDTVDEPFATYDGAAERRGVNGQLFSAVHHRDDFVETVEQLRAFDRCLFGKEFIPSQILSDMFDHRRKEFLETQGYIAERELMDAVLEPLSHQDGLRQQVG